MKAISAYPVMVLVLCLQLSPLPAAAEILHCQVIKVIDGDSLLVRVGGSKKEIRLWGIDSPEYDQPYARTAKKLTARLVAEEIEVKVEGRDGYNRILGIAYSGDICINRQLVALGGAWVYDYYCRNSECREWVRLERKARQEGRGLWADRAPVAPWEWRKLKR